MNERFGKQNKTQKMDRNSNWSKLKKTEETKGKMILYSSLYKPETSIEREKILKEIEEAYAIYEDYEIFKYIGLKEKSAEIREAKSLLDSILPKLRADLERRDESDYQSAYKACATAVLSLGFLGDSNSIPKIKELLDDERVGVKSNAAVALGFLQNRERIEDIRKMLNDRDPSVRRSAALSLALLNDSESFEKIEEMSHSEGDSGYAIKHFSFAERLISVSRRKGSDKEKEVFNVPDEPVKAITVIKHKLANITLPMELDLESWKTKKSCEQLLNKPSGYYTTLFNNLRSLIGKFEEVGSGSTIVPTRSLEEIIEMLEPHADEVGIKLRKIKRFVSGSDLETYFKTLDKWVEEYKKGVKPPAYVDFEHITEGRTFKRWLEELSDLFDDIRDEIKF